MRKENLQEAAGNIIFDIADTSNLTLDSFSLQYGMVVYTALLPSNNPYKEVVLGEDHLY
jgi:hypothetical protein